MLQHHSIAMLTLLMVTSTRETLFQVTLLSVIMLQLMLLLMLKHKDLDTVCSSTKVSQCTGQEQTPRLLLMLMQRLFLMDHTSSSMVSQDSMDHTQVLLLFHLASHKLAELLMLQHHSIAMLTLLMVTSTRETLFQVTLLLVIMLQLMLLLMPKHKDLDMVCSSTKVSQCTGQEQTPRLLLMLMQRLFLMDQRSSSMVSQDLMDHTQVLLLFHQESHKLAELLMLQHHSIAMLTLLMVTSTRETLFQVTLLSVIMLQLMLLLMLKHKDLDMVCSSTKVSQCTGQEQTPRLL